MSQAIADVASLFAAAALRTKVVSIRGTDVRIRELSVAARDEFLTAHSESRSEGVAVLLFNSVLDADGNQMLTHDQARELVGQSSAFVEPLIKEIIEFSGLGEDQGDD